MSDLSPLQRLHRIQVLDLDLDRLRNEERDFPAELREARHEQDRLNNALEDTEIRLEDLEKRIRQSNLDLASIKEQIERTKEDLKEHALDVRAQSQYSGRLHQLETRAEEIEEELIPMCEEEDALKDESAQLRQQHRDLRPKLSDLELADEKRIDGLREQSAQTLEEREQLAQQLDARIVKEYAMVRKAKKGVGLTETKNGRCTACNLVLPVAVQQKVSRAKMPPVKCPSCGRFLVKADFGTVISLSSTISPNTTP